MSRLLREFIKSMLPWQSVGTALGPDPMPCHPFPRLMTWRVAPGYSSRNGRGIVAPFCPIPASCQRVKSWCALLGSAITLGRS